MNHPPAHGKHSEARVSISSHDADLGFLVCLFLEVFSPAGKGPESRLVGKVPCNWRARLVCHGATHCREDTF